MNYSVELFSAVWILKGGRKEERESREKIEEKFPSVLFQLTGNGLKVVPRHDIASINSGSKALHMANDPLVWIHFLWFQQLSSEH